MYNALDTLALLGMGKILKPVFIYELLDPLNNEVRYVGKTINLKKRLETHLSTCQLKAKTHKNSWIKSLLNKGVKPEMRVVAITTDQYANDAEILKILEHKRSNTRLTNMTDGGDGQSHMIQEVKEKIRKALKGAVRHPCSEETKKKISTSQVGKPKPKSKWTTNRFDKQCRRVVSEDIFTGLTKEYQSSASAARDLGVDRASIHRAASRNAIYKGFSWRFNNVI